MLAEDNLRFDSVWRNGKRVTVDELAAARNGAYVLWREDKTSSRSYSCSVALSDPNGSLAPLGSGKDVQPQKIAIRSDFRECLENMFRQCNSARSLFNTQ